MGDSGATYLVRNAPADVVHTPAPGRPGSSMPPPPDSPYAAKIPPAPATPKLDRELLPLPALDEAPSRPSELRPTTSRAPHSIERVGRIDMDAISEPPPPIKPRSHAAKLLRELCSSPPGQEALVIDRILQGHVEEILPRMTAVFPGPLWFDRKRPHRRVPTAAHVSAIVSAFVRLGDPAVPYVAHLLRSDDEDQKFYAAIVAAELPDARLLRSLWRLALGGDEGGRRAALHALRAHSRLDGFDHALEAFRTIAGDTDSRQSWRLRALEAISTIGDAASVEVLIEALSEKDRSIARAAHDALVSLTCHDLGPLRRPWRRWNKAHGQRHRVEWLLDALGDRRKGLRLAAWRELANLSGNTCGLAESAPRSEFEAARSVYARWWQSQ